MIHLNITDNFFLVGKQNLDGENARIADYFDVIAGTSTGSILTAMLTVPDPNKKDRPLYAASQITKFYQDWGPQIFKKDRKIASSQAGDNEKSQRNIADEEGFLTKVVTWIGSTLSTSNFAEMLLGLIAQYNSIDSIPGLENTPYKNLSRVLFSDTLSKTTIVIPTFSLTNCKPLIFSSNMASYLNWDDDYDDEVRLSDVVLGSTAAPKPCLHYVKRRD
ncbi:hypothetical protein Ddye_017217 [Dipteronia dyeriana]|uniref:Patatin n=1 Tax=Dipteronia dyeriana TaxID=168575 RepID=A0AAD9X0R7_9ROSI|nr:hypothetical protein Ddye_017217 [Dipteronia dyeriana]